MQVCLKRFKGSYTDNSRVLDINRMVKKGCIPSFGYGSGSWVWSDAETGETLATISYEVKTNDKDNSYLRIHYVLRNTGQKIDYKIALVRTPLNYGGERFWFLCPVTRRRVSKLYMPFGNDIFASRHAFGLKYNSQSEAWQYRLLRKNRKMLRKTGGEYYPIKPKGMHRKTYERIVQEYEKNEMILYNYMLKFLVKK